MIAGQLVIPLVRRIGIFGGIPKPERSREFQTVSRCRAVSPKTRGYKVMAWWKPLLYLWVLPGSLVGLLFIPLALITGGGARFVDGVLEAYGGWVTKLLEKPFWFSGPIAAITLGHVVLGCDRPTLARTRQHERVHVRQYERWGPFFIPAYVLASLWIRFRGGDAYLDNPFEVEAYGIDDCRGDHPD
jgi:hypothetical protein